MTLLKNLNEASQLQKWHHYENMRILSRCCNAPILFSPACCNWSTNANSGCKEGNDAAAKTISSNWQSSKFSKHWRLTDLACGDYDSDSFAAARMCLDRAFMSFRYIHAVILHSPCSRDGWLLFHSPAVSSRKMCRTTFQAAICVPV